MNARPKPSAFLAVTPSMRQRIETTVENLLALLDEIDGDENLEPDLAGFDLNTRDDREEDQDFEPLFGSPDDLEHDSCDYGETIDWSNDANLSQDSQAWCPEAFR